MSYRQLLLWLQRDAETREDALLDMEVVVRVEDGDGEIHVGGLYFAEVDAGCAEADALILDAAQYVSNPEAPQ